MPILFCSIISGYFLEYLIVSIWHCQRESSSRIFHSKFLQRIFTTNSIRKFPTTNLFCYKIHSFHKRYNPCFHDAIKKSIRKSKREKICCKNCAIERFTNKSSRMSFKSIQTVHSTHHHMYTILKWDLNVLFVEYQQNKVLVTSIYFSGTACISNRKAEFGIQFVGDGSQFAWHTERHYERKDMISCIFFYPTVSYTKWYKSDSSGKHIFSWVFILVLVRMSLYAKQCQNQHFPFDARLAFYEHAYFVCLCETTKDEVKNCICDGTTIRAKIYKHKRA